MKGLASYYATTWHSFWHMAMTTINMLYFSIPLATVKDYITDYLYWEKGFLSVGLSYRNEIMGTGKNHKKPPVIQPLQHPASYRGWPRSQDWAVADVGLDSRSPCTQSSALSVSPGKWEESVQETQAYVGHCSQCRWQVPIYTMKSCYQTLWISGGQQVK